MSDTQLLTPSLEISVDGKSLNNDAWSTLISVEIDQHLSSIDRVELRFDDQLSNERKPKGSAPTFDVGAAVRVSLVDSAGKATPVFSGEVTAVSTEWRAGLSTIVYEALDLRHRLIRRLTPTTTLKGTATDILRKIASGAGLQAEIPSKLGSKFDSITFAGTDLETLRKIERLSGAASYVDAKGKLVLFLLDTAPSVTVQGAEELLEFEATWSPLERAKQVTVSGWDQATGKPFEGVAKTTTAYPKIGLKTSADLLRAGEYRESRVRAVSNDHANELAAGTARRFRAREVRGRGAMLPNGLLRPGVQLQIKGVNDRFNGSYPIVAVQHLFDGNGLVTRFEIGPADDGIADALLDGAASPSLTVGRVTDNKDPDKVGRVKVSLPLIGEGLQTDWVRTTTIGAAAGRGVAFLPEIDDEVVVGFLHGDLNDGYVLGVLWNSDPGGFLGGLVGDSGVVERRLTARLGNQIRLIDKSKGDETSGISIEVDDAKTKLFLGYTKTELRSDGKPIELTDGKASIKLDGGKITITADEITLKSTGKVAIDGNAVEAKAKTTVDLNAASQATLKANGTVTVQASGMTTIKGATVKVN